MDSKVKSLSDCGEAIMEKCPESVGARLRPTLDDLVGRWDQIKLRVVEQRAKFDEASAQAAGLNENLSGLMAWLTETEQALNNLSPVSRLLENITKQIEEHKVFLIFLIRA